MVCMKRQTMALASRRIASTFMRRCVSVIIFIVIVIECTEKRYKYQENESTGADFNRLGDFYDRDNAHSGCFFSDRDTREHGRYV